MVRDDADQVNGLAGYWGDNSQHVQTENSHKSEQLVGIMFRPTTTWVKYVWLKVKWTELAQIWFTY